MAKTKAIEKIETRMGQVDEESIRYKVLENAKNFKASWVGLGQALYAVWKDRLFKDWGYLTFEAYTSKEIGVKKNTALKLLRSYYFLEKEEASYLRDEYDKKKEASSIPTLDAIDTLRLASKKKMLDKSDYIDLRKKVLDEGRDARDVKHDLTQLIRQRDELEPDEARAKRRQALIRRYISTLKSLKTELEAAKMLPAAVLSDTAKLLSRLEAEMER